MKYTWKRIPGFSCPNLTVLIINGVEVGFIDKPRDTKTDKNAWRVFRGIGENAKLLCHNYSKSVAQKILEEIFVGA